jgi:hypothetical protein
MTTVQIVWDVDQTNLKETHVYPVDLATKKRGAMFPAVPAKSNPTAAAPFSIPLGTGGPEMVEIVTVDLAGVEAPSVFLPIPNCVPAANAKVLSVTIAVQ